MKNTILVIALLALIQSSILLAGGAKRQFPELEVVPSVDLNQYMGKWYEIARLPQTFEKNCVGVTAEYELRNDGKVNVKNTCHKSSCSGKISVANGVAEAGDSNAKLKVSFFWPFKGDYWILELGPNYTYAVVGSPDRKYFWILSRTPLMPSPLRQSILDKYKTKGFDFTTIEEPTACE